MIRVLKDLHRWLCLQEGLDAPSRNIGDVSLTREYDDWRLSIGLFDGTSFVVRLKHPALFANNCLTIADNGELPTIGIRNSVRIVRNAGAPLIRYRSEQLEVSHTDLVQLALVLLEET